MRCYLRLVLGQQKHTSWIKREQLNGTIKLHQVRGHVCACLGVWMS